MRKSQLFSVNPEQVSLNHCVALCEGFLLERNMSDHANHHVSYLIIEKSDSTVAVLGNAEANPLQKLLSHGKQLFVGNQSSLISIDTALFYAA